MLRLECPICGLRDESEFSYGGDASVTRPADGERAMRPWLDYVFCRDNPRGRHLEYWQHQHGCRQWLVVERNTLTHEITSVRLARDVAREAAAAKAGAPASKTTETIDPEPAPAVEASTEAPPRKPRKRAATGARKRRKTTPAPETSS